MATERYAREDVTIAGVTIRRGEMVGAVIASANRDEQQFPNPDVLDITRQPNKHLAFGQGNHFCLGAPLAGPSPPVFGFLRRIPRENTQNSENWRVNSEAREFATFFSSPSTGNWPTRLPKARLLCQGSTANCDGS